MNQIIYGAIWSFFFLSLSANLFLFLHIKTAVKRAKDEVTKAPEKTYDVKALLADLSVGSALIRMERIDPHDVLLHSPRQFR